MKMKNWCNESLVSMDAPWTHGIVLLLVDFRHEAYLFTFYMDFPIFLLGNKFCVALSACHFSSLCNLNLIDNFSRAQKIKGLIYVWFCVKLKSLSK